MNTYGDGHQALSWEQFKALPMGKGDFLISATHAEWNEAQQMVVLVFADNEIVPLVDVVRHCIDKGVLKMLFLGCEVSHAAEPLASLLRCDPSIARPADRNGGYQGLDITVVGAKGETVSELNREAGLLFMDDCVSLRNGAKAANAMQTYSVQPQFTVGWDKALRQLSVAQRTELTADQLDPGLTPEQSKALKKSLLLMHLNGDNDVEIDKLLTLHRVSADVLFYGGTSALKVASDLGRLKAATCLMDRGANIDHTDDDGETSLYGAALFGHSALVAELLTRGADLHKATLPALRTRTPLHAASARGDAEIVQMLLDKGANAAAQDLGGASAADLAQAAGHPRLAQRLRDWAAAQAGTALPLAPP